MPSTAKKQKQGLANIIIYRFQDFKFFFKKTVQFKNIPVSKK